MFPVAKDELIGKVKNLAREKKLSAARAIRLQLVVKKIVKEGGVAIDTNTHQLLKYVMEGENNSRFDERTPHYLLW